MRWTIKPTTKRAADLLVELRFYPGSLHSSYVVRLSGCRNAPAFYRCKYSIQAHSLEPMQDSKQLGAQ